MNKNIVGIVIGALVLIGGFFVYKKTQVPTVLENTGIVTSDETGTTRTQTTTVQTSSQNTNGNTTSTTTTTGTTTGTNTVTTGPKTFTMADVAMHSSQSDCFSAINNSVYDLTSWIANHPGGEGAILGICGKDGSSAFDTKHGMSGREAAMLAKFKIGILTK